MSPFSRPNLLFLAPGDLLKSRVEPLQWVRMCEYFAKTGYRVNLVSTYARRTENISKNDLWSYYDLDNDLFSITILPTPLTSASSTSASQFWGVLMHSLFVGWHILLGEKIDVLYARKYAYLLPYLACRRFLHYSTLIYELHSMPTNKLGTNLLRKADGIVVNSAILKKDLVDRLSLVPEKICVAYLAPHAVSHVKRIPRDEARRELGLNQSDRIVCYTGKLLEKEIDVILEAAQLVPQGVEFVIVGGNSKILTKLKNIIRVRRINNIHFVGFMPPSKTVLYQQAADILLVNYTHREHDLHRYMTPGKVFEYLDSGRPIIASCFDALDEILQNNHNALLFEPGDSKSLAESIRKIIENPSLSFELVKKATESARFYTWENRIQKIHQFISDLHSKERSDHQMKQR